MWNKHTVIVGAMESGTIKCFSVADVDNGFMKDVWIVYNIPFIVETGNIDKKFYIFGHYILLGFMYLCVQYVIKAKTF